MSERQSDLSVLVKRETGENPVRTRHCDKGVSAKEPLMKIGKAAANVDLSARRPALDLTRQPRVTGLVRKTRDRISMSILPPCHFTVWRFFV